MGSKPGHLFHNFLLVLSGAAFACAQSPDDLNVQIHGYATQSALYTTKNNILTTNSSDGSLAWTDAVVNVSSFPIPKLHVAFQARYFHLGEVGNRVTLDWAAADYKVNEHLGLRFGKVKTPAGLFNEIQDIDPAYIWSLLPQSVYPVLSRDTILAHYGGVLYGSTSLGDRHGKLDYRAWAGEIVIGPDDGFLIPFKNFGLTVPKGLTKAVVGGTLQWKAPLRGLKIGATELRYSNAYAPLDAGPLAGTLQNTPIHNSNFFAQYERNRFMLAYEYLRTPFTINVQLPPVLVHSQPADPLGWYAMGTLKISNHLAAGVYHSQSIDHQADLSPSRYSKDWALSARYDFNQFLYAKAEQHFIDGTANVYSNDQNAGGLQPNTRLSILKLGVSF